ncbi:acetyltransferase [Actinoplanes sp. SE50]|uniref:GNAT family N-acetyltransferase n=1 Tax=unclassified Actinoplanes TaxID=2626549 RepID=UPI00023ECCC2|nr:MULTISPECIES: GNAT family N-acetyltransferase [unclassified Actinoplanes]AEV84826.1 GCN5-related N-acetyltransferase [Actinoplanes sp. SE50/110]ATO83218.1 acetyltransferase [Actinoplanes sp. SE50]SLM00625.1 acetyltransferase [Actinoplanes sp. SE50/110]
MIIRECREDDIVQLEFHHPSPGRTRRNEARFHRQQQGLSTFLTAWADGIPVGAGDILWQGCEAAEVHERYPDCPEINGLAVWPAEQQSRGIGTAIIQTAETLAARRGYHHIGLGVDDQNPRAAALYLRLGFQDIDCHYLDRYHYLDDHGTRHDFADPCRFLVKPLRNGPGR